jgi:DNA-binding response OmpR family regulator
MSPRKRVVILDDHEDFAEFVGTVAEELGFDVTVTTHHRAFREAYLQAPPDLVVLDIVMPEQDGIEIIRWLVEQDCTARVIVVSGYNPAYATAARRIGELRGRMQISELQKPVRLAVLRQALLAGG